MNRRKFLELLGLSVPATLVAVKGVEAGPVEAPIFTPSPAPPLLTYQTFHTSGPTIWSNPEHIHRSVRVDEDWWQ